MDTDTKVDEAPPWKTDLNISNPERKDNKAVCDNDTYQCSTSAYGSDDGVNCVSYVFDENYFASQTRKN